MKKIHVGLKKRGYDVVIGNGVVASMGRFLKKAGCEGSAIIITNPAIKRYWGIKVASVLKKSGIEASFLEIPDTEKSKSIATSLKLLNRLTLKAKSKKIFIVALGGGVVGDVAGFVASIYKRGVPYIQVPTTLLAQVDSAIGGKVAIDLKAGKNLAGAFYQPRLVLSDTAFLSTLPKRQILNGLSEIIKSAVIKDPALFKFIENNLKRILRLDKAATARIISRTSAIKARLVEKDEYDRLGIRIALNYGHTIGHAIEAASGFSKKYMHGEAISVGMTAANFIAVKLGLLSKAISRRITRLLENAGLPTKARGIDPKKVYAAHLHDKKFIGAKNRFVLISGIGRVTIEERIPAKLIKEAIAAVCAS
jgi:3-dehydroquinate synthase